VAQRQSRSLQRRERRNDPLEQALLLLVACKPAKLRSCTGVHRLATQSQKEKDGNEKKKEEMNPQEFCLWVGGVVCLGLLIPLTCSFFPVNKNE